MNWRNSFSCADKFRITIYATMTLIFGGLIFRMADVVRQIPDQVPERTIKASYSSPSGLHWLLLVNVYQQVFISLIDWNELEIGGVEKPDERRAVLKFVGRVYEVSWLDSQRAKIAIDNTSVISDRVKIVDGVQLDVEFRPNDPITRRERLVATKTPKKYWWMCDIPSD